jgi:hypothetical protein
MTLNEFHRRLGHGITRRSSADQDPAADMHRDIARPVLLKVEGHDRDRIAVPTG